MFKKLFIVGLMLAMVVGFTGMVSANPASAGCPNCPTTVVNVGGGGQLQGWGNVGIGNGDPISGNLGGHYQAGGTGSLIWVKPGFSSGYAVNGNTYAQGMTTGAGIVSTGAGITDHSLNGHYDDWYNETALNAHLNVDGYAKKNGNSPIKWEVNGDAGIRFKDIHQDSGFNANFTETNFGSVSAGSLDGPGTYQGQAGFNYTKVRWNGMSSSQ